MVAPGVQWLGGDTNSRLSEAALLVAIAFEAQTHNCHSKSSALGCSVQRGWLEMSLSGCALWFLSRTTCWMVLWGWVRVMYWVPCMGPSMVWDWMGAVRYGAKNRYNTHLLKIPQRANEGAACCLAKSWKCGRMLLFRWAKSQHGCKGRGLCWTLAVLPSAQVLSGYSPSFCLWKTLGRQHPAP